ncbi:50S ribosomal protein L27 [Candidatus Dependentiae bacterium]|nr:50S ribosomal protein L27 [Candidatus Dependentiae bacterium]
MSTSKSGGSTQNGRDSQSKRLGCKKFGGQAVHCGQIIIRQRGTKFHPGHGVRRGGDDTLFAVADGTVHFHKGFKRRMFVSVKEK